MAAMASRNFAKAILNGAPPLRPLARADAKPAFVRSEVHARIPPALRRFRIQVCQLVSRCRLRRRGL